MGRGARHLFAAARGERREPVEQIRKRADGQHPFAHSPIHRLTCNIIYIYIYVYVYVLYIVYHIYMICICVYTYIYIYIYVYT